MNWLTCTEAEHDLRCSVRAAHWHHSAETPTGWALWPEREQPIVAPPRKTTSASTLAYPTLHLGRGTKWIKPKK